MKPEDMAAINQLTFELSLACEGYKGGHVAVALARMVEQSLMRFPPDRRSEMFKKFFGLVRMGIKNNEMGEAIETATEAKP